MVGIENPVYHLSAKQMLRNEDMNTIKYNQVTFQIFFKLSSNLTHLTSSIMETLRTNCKFQGRKRAMQQKKLFLMVQSSRMENDKNWRKIQFYLN